MMGGHLLGRRRKRGARHGFGVMWQLTYLFENVFFILKHHTVCPVHRGLDSVLLAEEVEELRWAQLVPPLVRSRAEVQTQR